MTSFDLHFLKECAMDHSLTGTLQVVPGGPRWPLHMQTDYRAWLIDFADDSAPEGAAMRQVWDPMPPKAGFVRFFVRVRKGDAEGYIYACCSPM